MKPENASLQTSPDTGDFDQDTLFAGIADDLYQKGYSVQPNALPPHLADALLMDLHRMRETEFRRAGIGRADDFLKNDFVRTDNICWIRGDSDPSAQWLEWTAQLQAFLNRRLFLGLFSFESHYAHYRAGDFYKRHVDAFKGEANRILTVVTYLNPDWTLDDGGEMMLYSSDDDRDGLKITPGLGTVAIFLSEEFPHEVLPSRRDRFSIAGWYRVNASINGRIDPPR